MDLSNLPTLNACLNAAAGVLLFSGWRAIKQGKKDVHRNFMIAALICSAVFLCSYVTCHVLKEGVVTRYTGEGILRVIYYTILLTYTPLAVIIVPFCIVAVYHAYKKNCRSCENHKVVVSRVNVCFGNRCSDLFHALYILACCRTFFPRN